MKNPSIKKFDNQLSAISRLAMIPAMMPYIGADYESSLHKKLLIIGESYYFPDESTIHKNAEAWYRISQTELNEEEVCYIHCRSLIECDWSSAGHKMYRELNSCLNDLRLPMIERSISHIAFMNTFFRPASIPGESFKHYCQALDIEESLRVLPKIIEILSPDLVIFTSKYSWDSIGCSLQISSSIKRDFVSHPADPFHWNVDSYSHGKAKFIKILNQEFLNNPNVHN